MRIGSLTALVGFVVAVVGLAIAGIAYSRRSGAELLTRGIWSGNAGDRDRRKSAEPDASDHGDAP